MKGIQINNVCLNCIMLTSELSSLKNDSRASFPAVQLPAARRDVAGEDGLTHKRTEPVPTVGLKGWETPSLLLWPSTCPQPKAVSWGMSP